MSENLGIEGASTPPPAGRAVAPGWRDPRLWIGLAIVAASVVVGARLLATADDTVPVWAVSTTLGPGERVGADDLVSRQVRLTGDDLARYVPTDEALPDDLALTRAVGAGELLPRGAVGSAAADPRLQISIEVDPGKVPQAVGSGSVVDVYLLGGTGDREPRSATKQTPALAAVTVVAAPALADSFGTSGLRQLVLAVPEPEVSGFYGRVERLDDPTISIVARPE